MNRLKSIFGPTVDEVWEKLCDQINGEIVSKGIWKDKRIEGKYKCWTIILDCYTIMAGQTPMTYTRIRVPFINVDDFRFKVYNKNILNTIGKEVDMEEMKTENEEFDNNYIIKTNNIEKMKTIISKEKIFDIIARQKKINLEIRDDEGKFGVEFPQNIDEIYFHTLGIIKDGERLKDLYNLFCELLDLLCEIGSSYESKAVVEL